MRIVLPVLLGLFVIGILSAVPQSYAGPQTVTNPMDGNLSLQVTTTMMFIPEDNELPWGHVRGVVNDPAETHPVIIQFHKDGDLVHVAQVELDADGTYEYKFRVRDMVDGSPVNIYQGAYTVKIFKVIYNDLGLV